MLVNVPAVSELPARVYVRVCSPDMCIFSPYILKYSFVPPSFTLGKNFLASPPAVANTIAEDRTALPGAEVARLTAFLLNSENAGSKLPFKVSAITPPVALPVEAPWFRYCATLRPAAIPVIDGCGIAILLRAIFFLLLPVALRAVLRRIPFLVDRLRLRDVS